MAPADVEIAAETARRGGWGERGAFFAFAAGHPECDAIVATTDGEIVGTGVGTANGAAGWVGAIFVSPARRGHGLGRALTVELIDRLNARDCRTLILTATELGRPIYERLGFVPQSRYHILEARGRPTDAPPDSSVRAMTEAHLAEAAALDRRATGEDRAHLLRAFVPLGGGWVVADPSDSHVRAYLLRAPWGGGATVATDPGDAVRLLDHRRAAGGPDHPIRAGLLAENAAGLRLLAERGWYEVWNGARMACGDPLDWRPEWLWGQFNHALG